MDIQQWLDNAVDRAPPPEAHSHALDSVLRPPSQQHDGIRKYKHRHKRTLSDSSLIEPLPLPSSSQSRQPHRPRRVPPGHVPYRRSYADGASSRGCHRTDDSLSVPSKEKRPVKVYERRARHKTRADRYEPKIKQRHDTRRRQKTEKGKRERRRRSHQNGDGAKTTDLVQSFQLQGRPQKSRLTLRPDIYTGLFRHGRASGQATAKGRGLPDLVFNEMRFLRKPREHQDEHDGPPQQSKNKSEQLHHEEISDHFQGSAANRRLAQNVTPADAPLSAHATQDAATAAVTRIPEMPVLATREEVKTTADVPENTFLGFGSRGGRPQSNQEYNAESGRLSWSESVPPRRSHNAPGSELGGRQVSVASHTKLSRLVAKVSEASLSICASSSLEHQKNASVGHQTTLRQKYILNASSTEEGFNMESFKARLGVAVSDHNHPATKAAEQSLSGKFSKERQEIIAPSSRPSESHLDHVWNTSDILKIQWPRSESSASPQPGSPSHGRGFSQNDNRNVDPSSDVALLQQALDALRQPTDLLQPRHTEQLCRRRAESYTVIREEGHSYDSGRPFSTNAAPQTAPFSRPSLGHHSNCIVASDNSPSAMPPVVPRRQPDASYGYEMHPLTYYGDGNTLLNADGWNASVHQNRVYACEREAQGLALWETDTRVCDPDLYLTPMPLPLHEQDRFLHISPPEAVSIGREDRSYIFDEGKRGAGNDGGGGGLAADGESAEIGQFEGFCRPNRLY